MGLFPIATWESLLRTSGFVERVFIKRNGNLSVDMDSHTMGLFPIATWESLLRTVRL